MYRECNSTIIFDLEWPYKAKVNVILIWVIGDQYVIHIFAASILIRKSHQIRIYGPAGFPGGVSWSTVLAIHNSLIPPTPTPPPILQKLIYFDTAGPWLAQTGVTLWVLNYMHTNREGAFVHVWVEMDFLREHVKSITCARKLLHALEQVIITCARA